MIEAWVDGEQIVAQELEGHKIEPYPGLELFAPFGIFNFDSESEFEDITLRELQGSAKK